MALFAADVCERGGARGRGMAKRRTRKALREWVNESPRAYMVCRVQFGVYSGVYSELRKILRRMMKMVPLRAPGELINHGQHQGGDSRDI